MVDGQKPLVTMQRQDCDVHELAIEGVRGLTPYEPGKPIEELERELGIRETIKLASNENPLGPSSRAVAALGEAVSDVAFYPDGNGFVLKRALARRHGVPESSLTLGNGSNDVLELVARAFLGPGRQAVFSQHAFAVYPIVTQATGATAQIAPANAPDSSQPYGHDLDAMAQRINRNTRVVFVANPNNPTGTWLSANALADFLDHLPLTTLCVVDEAYFEYVEEADYPNTALWLERYSNLIVTRTFSKIFGLAGLRVGYALSHPDVAELLNRVRQPFNVNSLAQVAALAAIDDADHVAQSIALNRAGREQLVAALTDRGLGFIPSVGNFICIDVGREAGQIYQGLLRKGVIVRPVAGYGLPSHLRVTIGSGDQNRRFITALDEVLPG